MDCSICLESFNNINKETIITNCKHQFHKSCLDSWTKINNSCPNCRTDINYKQYKVYEINKRYKVYQIYTNNYFEGVLDEISIIPYSGSKCYKFTNIRNSKFPMGTIAFMYEHLSQFYPI